MHQLMAVYPMIYKILYIHPRWCRISSINSITGSGWLSIWHQSGVSKRKTWDPKSRIYLVASYTNQQFLGNLWDIPYVHQPALRYIWWWHIPKILPVKHQFGKLRLTSLVWPNQFYTVFTTIGGTKMYKVYGRQQPPKVMSRKPCSVACTEQGSISVVQCPLLLAMLGLQVWWRYCACCGKGTTARVTRGCRWRCILQSTSLRRPRVLFASTVGILKIPKTFAAFAGLSHQWLFKHFQTYLLNMCTPTKNQRLWAPKQWEQIWWCNLPSRYGWNNL